MSLKLPDFNGHLNAADENRLSFRGSVSAKTYFLEGYHSFFLIHVGNILRNAIITESVNGGLNNAFHVLTNGVVTTNGRTALFFNWNTKQFELDARSKHSGCNGSTRSIYDLKSPVVTADNCEWLLLEKEDSGDGINFDWTLSIVDKDGAIARGVTTSSTLCGLQTHGSSNLDYYVGSYYNAPVDEAKIGRSWVGALGHLLFVNSATTIADFDTKIGDFIISGTHPDTVWGTDVRVYRTLDGTPAGYQPASVNDTDYTDIVAVNPVNRIKAGSDPIPVDVAGSVVLYESKRNLVSVPITKAYGLGKGTVNLSGRYVGTVSGIEYRLIAEKDQSVVQGWSDLAANLNSGSWTATLNGVEPNIYQIELRPANNQSAVYAGRNEWVVAPAFALLGQSQLVYLSEAYTADKSGFPYHPTEFGRVYYGLRGSLFRPEQDYECSDFIYGFTEAWARLMGDTPVILTSFADAGEGHGRFLNNTTGDNGKPIMDNIDSTVTALGVDTFNILINWGTSDASGAATDPENYYESVRGLMFDTVSPANAGTGKDYTGASYKHLTDYITVGAIAVTGLTRHDEAGDVAYVNSNNKQRIRQIDFWRNSLIPERDNKIIIGTFNNDTWMGELTGTQSNPHPVGVKGDPRVAESLGISAAWLSESITRANPVLRAGYASADGLQLRVPVRNATGGTITTPLGTSEINRVEVLDWDDGTYSSGDITATWDIAAQEIVVTRDDASSWATDVANQNISVYYTPPITNELTPAEAEEDLDTILIEPVSYMPRGLQVESSTVRVYSNASQAYAPDLAAIENDPEAPIANTIAHFKANADTADSVGAATTTGTVEVVNSPFGYQPVMDAGISWDGDNLAEVNVDANTGGYNVTDENGWVAKNS